MPQAKLVEFYVRSGPDPKKAQAIATAYLSSKHQEFSLASRACPFCDGDLGSLPQPSDGWPDVVSLICDLGFHRLEKA